MSGSADSRWEYATPRGSTRCWMCNGRWLPWYVGWTSIWGKVGRGRWMKRRLSKARRRAWKDSHERGLSVVETEASYKGW